MAAAEAIIFKRKSTSAKTTHSFKYAEQETTITDNATNIEISFKAGRTTTQVLLKKMKAENGDGDVTIVVSGDADVDLVADDDTEEILRVDLMLGRGHDRKLLEARAERAEEKVVAHEPECENHAAKSKSTDERATRIDMELASLKERYIELSNSLLYGLTP